MKSCIEDYFIDFIALFSILKQFIKLKVVFLKLRLKAVHILLVKVHESWHACLRETFISWYIKVKFDIASIISWNCFFTDFLWNGRDYCSQHLYVFKNVKCFTSLFVKCKAFCMYLREKLKKKFISIKVGLISWQKFEGKFWYWLFLMCCLTLFKTD